MSGLSDENYLRAWAERADETAFRALVGRYAGFIYGAALRRVGDAGLAEEITQDVFARLSQNAARLVGHPAISGWLHRSAMLIALDRLRRRRRAERRIAQLSQMNTPTAADPLAEALPHLDEALDQLATRDREVLVLHFFDRLTFPEIATRLGGSADAARMRTNRALSALSASLRKKGVTLSVTALAAGLGGTFAQAAPASLAIIPTALGAGKVSALSVIIHALQTMKTAKAAALTALALVLATPLIFQQQQISAAEARIAAMANSREKMQSALPVAVSSRGGKSAKEKAPGIDIQALGDAALDELMGMATVNRAVERLDNNNLVGLIETVMQGGLRASPRHKLLGILLGHLARRDPALHVEWAIKVLLESFPNGEMRGRNSEFIPFTMLESFRTWTKSNPEQAHEWASMHADDWNKLTGWSLDAIFAAASYFRAPDSALSKMEKFSEAQFRQALSDIKSVRFVDDDFQRLGKWAAALQDTKQRREFVMETIQWRVCYIAEMEQPEKHDTLSLSGLLLSELTLDDDDLCFVAACVSLRFGPGRKSASEMAKKSFPWLERVLPSHRASYVKGGILAGANDETFSASGVVKDAPNKTTVLIKEHERSNDDDFVAGYVEAAGKVGLLAEHAYTENGLRPFQMALRVRDPERRLELLSIAATKLPEKDFTTVLNTSGLDDAGKREVRERVARRRLSK